MQMFDDIAAETRDCFVLVMVLEETLLSYILAFLEAMAGETYETKNTAGKKLRKMS